MNRSFRANESQMPAAVRQRQRIGSMLTSMKKEKEEDLALFLEMRKREKDRNSLLLQNSDDLDALAGSKPGVSPIFNLTTSAPPPKTGSDDFLNSEDDKNDYDWLLTPPGTPLFPSLEMESQKSVMSSIATPKARPTVLKSRLANPQQEPSPRNNFVSRHSTSSPGLNSSSSSIRRLSSSAGPVSRSATPTGRPASTNAPKPTSRSITPNTSRPNLSSTKPTIARSATPISRTTARSSTPTSRASLPLSKPIQSRAPTPTRRSSAPSTIPKLSTPVPAKPSSLTKSAPAPSRGISPTVKSRPWKPSEMPGFSLDAPPNLRTSIPERSVSSQRGRAAASGANARSISIDPNPNPSGRPRRQSCSPSRGRPPNVGGIHASGSSVPAVSRRPPKISDNVSPVQMGTKMVERVINMRRLVPPKMDDKQSPRGSLSGKPSSSPDGSGFGRTLSKKSLDMAIRHMDISRRNVQNNMRPLLTNIPASSMYSVRSGGASGSRTVSVSNSPLATSSNASSELSVTNNNNSSNNNSNNNNARCLNGGSEVEDDAASESLLNLRGR